LARSGVAHPGDAIVGPGHSPHPPEEAREKKTSIMTKIVTTQVPYSGTEKIEPTIQRTASTLRIVMFL
jgi:hypothetical protein